MGIITHILWFLLYFLIRIFVETVLPGQISFFDDTASIWSVMKDLSNCLLTVFGILIAILGYNNWKKESEFKYKNDIATRLMIAAFELREEFIQVTKDDGYRDEMKKFFDKSLPKNIYDQSMSAFKVLDSRFEKLESKMDAFTNLSMLAHVTFRDSVIEVNKKIRIKYDYIHDSFFNISYFYKGNFDDEYLQRIKKVFSNDYFSKFFDIDGKIFQGEVDEIINDLDKFLGKYLFVEKGNLFKRIKNKYFSEDSK